MANAFSTQHEEYNVDKNYFPTIIYAYVTSIQK